jgi:hypothetical protein
MSLLNSILNFLKKTPKATIDNNVVPEGLCSNCWGYQEYGGEFFEAVKNHDADVNSKNPNIGWVEEYANKHLSGIELKQKGDSMVCPNCKINYKIIE